jgi:hypothetical protein
VDPETENLLQHGGRKGEKVVGNDSSYQRTAYRAVIAI